MIEMHCNRNLRLCELFRACEVFDYRWVCCSAGIEQSEDMKRFIWYVGPLIMSLGVLKSVNIRNNHFAAVGSDQPALEVR